MKQISPDGRYVLSAGWVWHPWSSLMVFDLAEAIREPRSLDGRGLIESHRIANAEVDAAVFLDSDCILVTTSFDDEVLDQDAGTTRLRVMPGDRAERFHETAVWPVAGRA